MRVVALALRYLFGGTERFSFFRRLAYVPPLGWLSPSRALLCLAVRMYTMLSYARLSCLYELASRLDKEGIEGSVVECGCWKGGSSAVLAMASKRPLHIFDSFQGCPEPSAVDVNCEGRHGEAGEARAGIRDVTHLFGALRLDATIWPGWFQDTLPKVKAEVGPIALLHLDCDWYDSVRVALEHLYPLVVPGGYVVVDDYGHWEGCRKAIHEFLPPGRWMCRVDKTGVWFRK